MITGHPVYMFSFFYIKDKGDIIIEYFFIKELKYGLILIHFEFCSGFWLTNFDFWVRNGSNTGNVDNNNLLSPESPKVKTNCLKSFHFLKNYLFIRSALYFIQKLFD